MRSKIAQLLHQDFLFLQEVLLSWCIEKILCKEPTTSGNSALLVAYGGMLYWLSRAVSSAESKLYPYASGILQHSLEKQQARMCWLGFKSSTAASSADTIFPSTARTLAARQIYLVAYFYVFVFFADAPVFTNFTP